MKQEIKKSGIIGLLSDSNTYETEKGKISMLTPCRCTMNLYEIYCLEGSLFNDVERYDTLEEVENRINELLN